MSDTCSCGEPLYVKTAPGGAEFLACHHCDRPCGVWDRATGEFVHSTRHGCDLCAEGRIVKGG